MRYSVDMNYRYMLKKKLYGWRGNIFETRGMEYNSMEYNSMEYNSQDAGEVRYVKIIIDQFSGL